MASIGDVRALDTDTLLTLREQIEETLERRRQSIERQLKFLDSRRADAQNRPISPRYRSRRDPEKTWAGRGLMPRWMREEIGNTKLTKEHFRIK